MTMGGPERPSRRFAGPLLQGSHCIGPGSARLRPPSPNNNLSIDVLPCMRSWAHIALGSEGLGTQRLHCGPARLLSWVGGLTDWRRPAKSRARSKVQAKATRCVSVSWGDPARHPDRRRNSRARRHGRAAKRRRDSVAWRTKPLPSPWSSWCVAAAVAGAVAASPPLLPGPLSLGRCDPAASHQQWAITVSCQLPLARHSTSPAPIGVAGRCMRRIAPSAPRARRAQLPLDRSSRASPRRVRCAHSLSSPRG
jgi:hypothetical protein